MKKILILLFTLGFFTSCNETKKQSNTTKNPDTIVMKKDSAIKTSDTAGFNNK